MFLKPPLPPVTRLILIYYLATPLFWGGEWLFDSGFRIAYLERDAYRHLYYLFCMLCGLAGWLRPMWLAWIGVAESSVNLTLLILGIMVPVLLAPAHLLETGTAPAMPGPAELLTFMLSGSIWLVAYYAAMRALRKRA